MTAATEHNQAEETRRQAAEISTRGGDQTAHGRIRHTAGGSEDKRKGRQEGRREGRGWPRAWGGVEEGNGEEHGSRGTEQGENEKEIYKYLRERREEKRRRDSQTHVNVCIYILLNIVACWLFIALSFIYIEGSI